jgi:pimeloyl-ACP methyl ester carboxylesterase
VLRIAVISTVCLGLSCGPSFTPAAVQARSHAVDDKTESYFDGPWPDDRRLVDGKVPTRRFPRPGTGSLILNLVETGDKVLSGWGLSSPIYVPFSGPIDTASLPTSPADAVNASAAVYVTAVDPSSPAFGKRHPVDFRFLQAPTLYLKGNILAVRPFPGVPLEPKTTYALVVTRRLKDTSGQSVGAEESFWNALHGVTSDPSVARLGPALEQLHEHKDDVVGAFLFTTQPILDELLVLRDWLEARPAPSLDNGSVRERKSTFTVFEGTYRAPNLQHGEVPFSLTGGDFQYDAAGAPIPSVFENMRVSLCVPDGPAPPGGFPVVLYSHGTGGSYLSVVNDVCGELAAVGIVSVGIDQVFHGPRGGTGGGCFGMSVELCFFNPVNVVAGRNNTRQAALDNLTLRKMLAALSVPPTLDPGRRTLTFSAEDVGFFGHSQGGLSGAVYAAFDPHLKAAVLSGAGGHLTTTVLVRTEPFNVRSLAEGPLILGIEGQESLDLYHPAMAFIQALGDLADPASYGRYYVRRPQGAPKHLYLTNGLLDPDTSAFTAEVLAASASIPQLLPVGEFSQPASVAGVLPVAAPAQSTVLSEDGRPATAAFRQFPGQGHFPVFTDATARKQWVAFFDAALHGRPVVIVPP